MAAKTRADLLRRLNPYWKMEAANVLFVPVFLIWLAGGKVGWIRPAPSLVSAPRTHRPPSGRRPSTERWLRGRKHRTRNAAYLYGRRGFESRPLRHCTDLCAQLFPLFEVLAMVQGKPR